MSDTSGASYKGREVVGSDGEVIGKVTDIYLDDETGRPAWIAIHVGRLRSKTAFAPLHGASEDDGRIKLAFDRDTVHDAPGVDDGEDGYLSPEQEDALDRHYAGGGGGGQRSSEPDEPAAQPRARPARPTGRDRSGGEADAGDDGGMTRSEERLQVSTERVERERVRLRKHVVTEDATVTVPLSHDEVRLERQPITDENRDEVMADLGGDEQEVILYEERPVVTTESVPVERVRLVTERVRDEAEVTEPVRRERIERR